MSGGGAARAIGSFMDSILEIAVRVLLLVGVFFLAATLLNGGKMPSSEQAEPSLHGPLSRPAPTHLPG